jgi:hypothetical protein
LLFAFANKIRHRWRTATANGTVARWSLIPTAKLNDDFNMHTIIELDKQRHLTPLDDKRKIAQFSSFSLWKI